MFVTICDAAGANRRDRTGQYGFRCAAAEETLWTDTRHGAIPSRKARNVIVLLGARAALSGPKEQRRDKNEMEYVRLLGYELEPRHRGLGDSRLDNSWQHLELARRRKGSVRCCIKLVYPWRTNVQHLMRCHHEGSATFRCQRK